MVLRFLLMSMHLMWSYFLMSCTMFLQVSFPLCSKALPGLDVLF